MNASFTSGPWNIDQCSEDESIIYSGFSRQPIAKAYRGEDNGDSQANIALICAAPSLYAALHGLVDDLGNGRTLRLEAAKDALKQASGSKGGGL